MSKSKTLDELLDEVSYSYLNSNEYRPSAFALKYMNFIKLVNGSEGESNKTPPVHLAMLDKLNTPDRRLINLLFRGAAKALDVNTRIWTPDGFVRMGDIQKGDYVIDRNGNPTKVLLVSEEHKNQSYKITLGNGTSFIANEDHLHIVKRRSQDKDKNNIWLEEVKSTKELLKSPYYKRKITERNPTGREPKWFIPTMSECAYFSKKDLPIEPYTLGILLGDGNISDIGQSTVFCHVGDLTELIEKIPYKIGTIYTDKRRPSTKSFRILELNPVVNKIFVREKVSDKFVPEQYLYSCKEDRLALLRGLMDTDGTIDNKGYSSFTSTNYSLISAVQHLVSSLGGWFRTNRYENKYKGYWTVSIHLENDCPFSIKRKADIWKASIGKKSALHYSILDIEPVSNIISKCISVESPTKSYVIEDGIVTHNTSLFMEYLSLYLAVFGNLPYIGKVYGMIYVTDSIDNGVKNARQNIEHRFYNSEFLQQWIVDAKFTDKYIEFTNKEGKKLGIKLYGAATGIRGSKVFGKRPTLAILDDLIGDADAVSKATMDAIKDTVYKGVMNALDTNNRKIVFNGTPFNKEDVLVEAVESGAWSVNVYPVAEKFPCTKEEFRGAWEDRFSYDFLMDEYVFFKKNNKLSAFYQELMLRITNADERLVSDSDIQWYDSDLIINNLGNFNIYITTDFATSAKQHADFSVISVWAYNNNGDWFWIDGFCERATMDITMKNLFQLVAKYQPKSVGIEVNGQQAGFIPWIQREMMINNVWFNLAVGSNNQIGIRRNVDKLTGFTYVLPLFKNKKMYFPQDKKETTIMQIFLEQISLALKSGFKGKDDFLDTISMLPHMNATHPGRPLNLLRDKTGIWGMKKQNEISSISSYIV